MYKIYSLTNPLNGKVFYVGITYRSIEARLKEHLRSPNKRISKIVERLKNKELQPLIECLEQCRWKDVNLKERSWIEHFLSKGMVMYNSVLIPIKSSQPVSQNKKAAKRKVAHA